MLLLVGVWVRREVFFFAGHSMLQQITTVHAVSVYTWGDNTVQVAGFNGVIINRWRLILVILLLLPWLLLHQTAAAAAVLRPVSWCHLVAVSLTRTVGATAHWTWHTRSA